MITNWNLSNPQLIPFVESIIGKGWNMFHTTIQQPPIDVGHATTFMRPYFPELQ